MTDIPDGGDRRKHVRHPYPCKQWIAPYTGERFPALEEFFLVQCRDISSGGISFFLDDFPDFSMCIVRLHGAKYLAVRVRTATRSASTEHGRYIIGCQFLGMLNPADMPAEFERAMGEEPDLVTG